MNYTEYVAKQNELNAAKSEIKQAIKDEYLSKKAELKKLEAEFKAMYGESIDVSNKLTIEELKTFIDIVSKNPSIKPEDLKIRLPKHPKTLTKLLKVYAASDHTLESLKAKFKVA